MRAARRSEHGLPELQGGVDLAAPPRARLRAGHVLQHLPTHRWHRLTQDDRRDDVCWKPGVVSLFTRLDRGFERLVVVSPSDGEWPGCQRPAGRRKRSGDVTVRCAIM